MSLEQSGQRILKLTIMQMRCSNANLPPLPHLAGKLYTQVSPPLTGLVGIIKRRVSCVPCLLREGRATESKTERLHI